MTEAILLGTVAIRVPGAELEWSHREMRVKNLADAKRHLRRSYRQGWQVPGFLPA